MVKDDKFKIHPLMGIEPEDLESYLAKERKRILDSLPEPLSSYLGKRSIDGLIMTYYGESHIVLMDFGDLSLGGIRDDPKNLDSIYQTLLGLGVEVSLPNNAKPSRSPAHFLHELLDQYHQSMKNYTNSSQLEHWARKKLPLELQVLNERIKGCDIERYAHMGNKALLRTLGEKLRELLYDESVMATLESTTLQDSKLRKELRTLIPHEPTTGVTTKYIPITLRGKEGYFLVTAISMSDWESPQIRAFTNILRGALPFDGQWLLSPEDSERKAIFYGRFVTKEHRDNPALDYLNRVSEYRGIHDTIRIALGKEKLLVDKGIEKRDYNDYGRARVN